MKNLVNGLMLNDDQMVVNNGVDIEVIASIEVCTEEFLGSDRYYEHFRAFVSEEGAFTIEREANIELMSDVHLAWWQFGEEEDPEDELYYTQELPNLWEFESDWRAA